MKDIDDIIFDNERSILYAENSDGSGSSSGWGYKEVKAMLKEYALEIINEIETNSEYVCLDFDCDDLHDAVQIPSTDFTKFFELKKIIKDQ